MVERVSPKTRRTKSPTAAVGSDAAAGSDLSPALQRSQAKAKPSLQGSSDTLTVASGAASVRPAAPDLALMIAEAAYYRAERRGFSPGYEMEDWIAAEIELHARLNESDKQGSVDQGG